ncbi:MAG TPA: septal ring lytic transglycosylase RlpA family protein [Rhizobacter sp.]|nr:septal ring lytic transglycosylase RlpA family protein [Rhizobacter sp.]
MTVNATFTASRRALHLVTLSFALLLAACSTITKDGPEARPPPNLDQVPDAQPQLEPIRDGGPNKPYEQSGRSYTPLKGDAPLTEKGLASWYGKKFQGRRTASGEAYNMYAMTAAHKTMPIPSYARVRNPANGREIIVRVNDRGPFHSDRIIDLSYTAALKLGVLNGVAPVEVERITHEQIRTGSWQRDGQGAQPPETVAPLIEVSATTRSAAPAAPAPNTTPPAPQPAPDRAFTTAAQGYWVQLGAFRARDGAEQFQRRVSDELSWLSPLLAIFGEPQLYRLQAGPYPSRSEAQDAAARIREALKLVPVVIERR